MNRIKKKLSFLYKTLIKLLFIIIYGKIIFCKNPEKDKNIFIEEVKDENLKSPDNLKYYIYKIKNGRIFNDFVENVAIISGNKVIDKVSYQQVKREFKDANYNSVLVRGSTDVYVGDTEGSRTSSSMGTPSYGMPSNTSDGQYYLKQVSLNYLDSPSTTSSTTYKLQIRNYGGRTNFVNRTGNDTNSQVYPRTASSITVMEVSG